MKFMKFYSVISIAALVLGASGLQRLYAQAARPAPNRPGAPAAQPVKANTPKQPPCWQDAGISKASMEQRRSIQASRQSEIEAVCAQAGLTDQEKKERIRAINQATQQKMAGLITAEQQEKLKACNQARASAHPPAAHPAGAAHPGGPCSQSGH